MRKAFEAPEKPAEVPAEKPEVPTEVYVKTPEGQPMITSEDIERWKAGAEKIGGLFKRIKEALEKREEIHAEREIKELEKEIEKLKAEEEKAKRIEQLENVKKRLQEEVSALKMAKLKETI